LAPYAVTISDGQAYRMLPRGRKPSLLTLAIVEAGVGLKATAFIGVI
jgi:hypothetical protein